MQFDQYFCVEKNEWCSKHWIFKSYFEYLPTSLFDINAYREKSKIRWECKDILQLLYDVTACASYLQMNGIGHGLIKPDYIAVDQKGHYILCDHLKDASNYDINVMDYRLNDTHYQDPILWNNLTSNRNNIYDPFKNDVFSFGLILLQCCIIDNEGGQSDITVENLRKKTYNRQGHVDFYYIFAALQYVANKYSQIPVLYEALSRMLVEDNTRRLDWVNLQQMLPIRFEIQKYLNRIPQEQQKMSMEPVFSNNYNKVNQFRINAPVYTQPDFHDMGNSQWVNQSMAHMRESQNMRNSNLLDDSYLNQSKAYPTYPHRGQEEVVVEKNEPVRNLHQDTQHAYDQNANVPEIDYQSRVSTIPTKHVSFADSNNVPVRRQSHREDVHYPMKSVSYSQGNNNNVVSRDQYGTRSGSYVERMPTSSANQQHIPYSSQVAQYPGSTETINEDGVKVIRLPKEVVYENRPTQQSGVIANSNNYTNSPRYTNSNSYVNRY